METTISDEERVALLEQPDSYDEAMTGGECPNSFDNTEKLKPLTIEQERDAEEARIIASDSRIDLVVVRPPGHSIWSEGKRISVSGWQVYAEIGGMSGDGEGDTAEAAGKVALRKLANKLLMVIASLSPKTAA